MNLNLIPKLRRTRACDLNQLGWPIGVASEPPAGPLWCPWDRTAGVIGPQGSGKTLEAAQKVVEHGTPELVAAMDEGIQGLETLPGWSISSSS